jgi:hypothetical protein
MLAFVLLGMSSFAQTLKFKITDAETRTNVNGGPINKGDEFEICGVFGVDSIRNGKCPDGVAYDWNKASRIGRVKTRQS